MGPMTKTNFGDQVQQMWRTRPVRLPRQGPIAGVAAGFGQRYGVDPVLVRVAFVVSTIFGGTGIVLYLLAWLLCRNPTDHTSAMEAMLGKGQSSQSPTTTVVLLVALAIAVTTAGPAGVGLGGSGVISLALMLSGWWMLHLRTPEPPEALPDNTAGGLTGTGYPGTGYPPVGQENYSDLFGSYTPYTRLPDHYEPDSSPPRQSHTPGAQTAPPENAAPRAPTNLGDPPNDTGGVQDSKSSSAPVQHNSTNTVNPPDAATETGAQPVGRTRPPSPAGGPDLTRVGPAPDNDTEQTRTEAGPQHDTDLGHRVDLGKPSQPIPPVAPSAAGRTPPDWDPLGVAPLAWDLPAPAPKRPAVVPTPTKKRSWLTPVVLGLAFLAAAGAGAAAAAGSDWMTPGRITGTALAVVAVGLIIGAFHRRGHGLAIAAVPLAVVVIATSLIGPVGTTNVTMGEQTWAPTVLGDMPREYAVTVGSGTLDLRNLELTDSRSVHVSVRMGEAIVLIPEGMNVRTECTARMGEADCPDGLTGPGGDAPTLDLTVEVTSGRAEVRHA